ncbi:MAG: hypothetical protein ACI8RZ_001741 [Myxococcota bacterium]|jgi:hypothetical protein
MKVPLKVNTRHDQGAREGIFTGSLFAFFCDGCGFFAEVLPRGFLYQDPDHRLMVYLSPSGDPALSNIQLPPSFGDYRLRVVRDRVRLVEQLLIREAGLDDRHVMLFKAQVKPTVDGGQASAPEWTVFAGLLGEGSEVALSLPDGSVVALPEGLLDATIAAYPLDDEEPLSWQCIDDAWVSARLALAAPVQDGTWWSRK